ncbi:MAG: MBL fold metallo-hydrolase [Archaeoglobus sp.]|nr:MBL fold metallo-hydrolase [Archaeoglobus sp.]
MNSLEFLENFGFLPFRRKGKRGVKPHLSLRFNSNVVVDFHVDSYKGLPQEDYEFYNLITHAHSDHYGQNNLGNGNAVASLETAKILSATTGRDFRGRTFNLGEKLELAGIRIRTYPTEHIFGSSAFLLESDCKVLVTGDVKDFSSLPKCDVLITEATYGRPDFVFEDEIEKMIENAESSTFGVYPVGKAQRAAKILNENGYAVNATPKISKLCEIFGIEISNEAEVNLVSPKELYESRGRRFILTAQNFYRWPRIVVSDHLDFLGILAMIDHCDPEHVIFYHGRPAESLLDLLDRDYSLLRDLDVMSEGMR